MIVLAVDAGNTKTEAAVVDASESRVLAIARGGVGDIYSPDGPEAAGRVVTQAVDAALADAGIQPHGLAHAAFRLAGVDWPEDEQFWRDLVERTWPGLSASIKNDGQLFTYLADPSGNGVSVVLGTGGAIGGCGPAGEFAASWWLQHPMGAGGLVMEAIRAVALADLGLAPHTGLEQLLPELLGVDDVGGVLRAITGRGSDWYFGRLASLAPRVMELWGTDEVLTGIVASMARHVTDYVGAVAARCGLPPEFGIAVGGGMIRGAPQVGDVLRAELERGLPAASITITAGTALDGAIRAAVAEACG